MKNVVYSLVIAFLAAQNQYLIFASIGSRILIFISLFIGCLLVSLQMDEVEMGKKERKKRET